jgi:hypothetical protein
MNDDRGGFSIDGLERLSPEAQAIAVQEAAAVVKTSKRVNAVIYSVGCVSFFGFLSTCAVMFLGR